MNRGEIKSEILVRSGKTTTSAWISEAFLNDWINQAHRWAAGFKPWPYTEGRVQTTYSAVEEWDFEGYKADSFRFITIGNTRLQKISFEDYKIFKEEQPDSADYVYSDFGGLVYINTNTGLSGTLTAYGQYMPANIADGDENDEVNTVFAEHGDEGNEAIIEKVLGNISLRENDKQSGMQYHANCRAILQELWQRIQDEQHAYHTKDRGMWERMNIVEGCLYDDTFNRDQF